MKTLRTSEGDFGPFQSIELIEGGWRCDGIDFLSVVVGAATIDGTPPTPAAPVPPAPVVPESVPMRNARLALYAAGLLPAVQALIDGMEGVDGDLARIDWATALTVRRDSSLVARLIPELGRTDAEIDALFIAAAAIQ